MSLIQVTRSGAAIWVNASQIRTIEAVGNGSKIVFDDNHVLLADEKAQRVVALVESART